MKTLIAILFIAFVALSLVIGTASAEKSDGCKCSPCACENCKC